ncbi:dihydrofolate reductase family protein [Paucibacter sp. M5-1]|uniref:dihydrofolate reductase family protein n=1 Tax=Paucibacter sp. M5-1 TaxID=3015998 RepID=UPI0022B8A745|nr:dihydrofolate reductase family protein [Paucibacter sp. M5-1]MCZ7883197.1 dihydrofolate reductase family protein [Paucibacter sp. M5-1]
MRKIIAALQLSVDGLIEGPAGELDWIGSWDDGFGLMPRIDTCLLGGGMYPGYEQYWNAILADPGAAAPAELAYARFAAVTAHIVLSTRMGQPSWKHTRVVRDLAAIRALKQQPGRDMHALGGAAFVSSLLEAGLVDELCLLMHPLILGRGKPLFQGLAGRHGLRLLEARPLAGGLVRISYALGQGSA